MPDFGGASGAYYKFSQAIQDKYAKADILALESGNLEPRSVEYCSYILEALETGQPFKFNGNVLNQGYIKNLPDDACVEVPMFADRMGLHPTVVGYLPPHLAAMNQSNISVQSLAADAAFEAELMMPPMVKKGYSKEFTVSVTAISSTIGIIIPPSVPMVIIAGTLGISTGKLFMGGIIPGFLCGLAMMIVCYIHAKRHKIPKEEGRFEIKNVWLAFKDSFFALLILPLIMGAIISGAVSPTEVALVTVLYALIIGKFAYKELTWIRFKAALVGTVKTTAKIFLVVGVAQVFGALLTIAGFDRMVAAALLGISDSPIVILFIILGIFLIVGMVMEAISLIVLFMPIFYTVAMQVGLDPYHMSVLSVIILGVGLVTPPYGLCLFICCNAQKARIWSVVPSLIPFIIAVLIVTVIIAFVPWLTLGIASLAGM
jgi:tripartite ATP-independent transporter DctM subunit